MTREGGNVSMSTKAVGAILGAMITAAVAGGAGMTWLSRPSEDSVSASVTEHVRVDDSRDAVTRSMVEAQQRQLDRIEAALVRIEAKIPPRN